MILSVMTPPRTHQDMCQVVRGGVMINILVSMRGLVHRPGVLHRFIRTRHGNYTIQECLYRGKTKTKLKVKNCQHPFNLNTYIVSWV